MKLGILAAALMFAGAASAAPPASYALSKSVSLGTPDRWDYVVYDDQTNRVYVAHGDRLAVIDPNNGALVGEVQGIAGGTHGTAVSAATGEGFTDDGRNGKVIAFDLASLAVKREIPTDVDADAIALDRPSGHLFVIEGDPASLTVIDTKTDAPVATIKVGEKLEYAVADGKGTVYVAGNGSGDFVKIDVTTNSVAAHWPAPGCASPHGLAIDQQAGRLFLGCVNSIMKVVDTATGSIVASLPIGQGSDAVAFDPVRKRVFSSNGRDGTITAYQQVSADRYTALPLIKTTVSARTMAVDTKTGELLVAGADTTPNPTAQGRSVVKPGSLRLMIFKPGA